MNKILLFSDLHIAQHKKNPPHCMGFERLNECIKVLDWVLSTAIAKNIKNVIFAGDLFHDREKIDIIAYHLTYDTILKYSKDLNLYLLLGNHDMWFHDRWDVNSLRPFSSVENIHIIDKPTSVEINNLKIDFIPFCLDPISHLETLSNGQKRKLLIGHLALDGAKLHGSHYSDHMIEHDGEMIKVDKKYFRNWNKVFLGHYHGEQRIDNIEYIGSPLELSFGESYQEKHIIIYDYDDDKTDYVINDFSPRHLVVQESELGLAEIAGNFIKLKMTQKDDSQVFDLMKEVQDMGPMALEVIPYIKEEENIVVKDASKILECDDTFEAFVEQTGSNGLETDRLMNAVKTICQKKPELV